MVKTDKIANMDIFNYPEHASCMHYKADVKTGFRFEVILANEILKEDCKPMHHLLFVMTGRIEVQCDNYAKVIVGAMETVFLPKSCSCYIRVVENSGLMFLSFDNNLNICDRHFFQNLYKLTQELEYKFIVLPIRGRVRDFLDLLINYFEDGLTCSHLHEMKQKELFLLFRAYYSKSELVQFFYPIIGADFDFKNKVLENFSKAKSVEELAELIGFSNSEFRRRFLENFHEPVYRWMQKQKSKRIQYELLVGNDDMTTLAYRFGFSSAAHFNKFCHVQFGMSPTQFKKKLKSIE